MDANELFRMQMANAKGPEDPNARPEDLSDFLNKLFDKMGSMVTKLTGVNVNSAFNTGIFANAKIEQAGINVNNPILQKPLIAGNAEGGALAKMVIDGLQVRNVQDFSKVQAPPIDGAQIAELPTGGSRFDWSDMPIVNLGNLVPSSAGGGAAQSIEIG